MTPAPRTIQHRTCYKCHYEAETALTKCPRCRNRKLWTRLETRLLGIVLTVIGGFLMVVMGAVTVLFLGLAGQTGTRGSGPRFTGTKDQLYLAFAIFGFLLLFGFTAFVAGLWQIIFGRRNMILIWLVIGLGAIFLVGGAIFRVIVGD